MAVTLRRASGSSEAELFPDQRPVDISATPLVEDPLAPGRFSRKRKSAGFIERIKPPDETQVTKFHRKRKKRTLDPENAQAEADWDDDREGAEGTSPDRRNPASKVLPFVAIGTLVVVALLIALLSNTGTNDTPAGTPNSPMTPAAAADSAPVDYNEALRAITQFTDAKTVDELIRFIRDPERVVPLARDYYERYPYEIMVLPPISPACPSTATTSRSLLTAASLRSAPLFSNASGRSSK
ncbi:MAG: hypothetical protein O3C21_17295 [Verrucomicrobia bacterium]|nr:hypothetical protein [Verrucomicrobiota bacterium]